MHRGTRHALMTHNPRLQGAGINVDRVLVLGRWGLLGRSSSSGPLMAEGRGTLRASPAAIALACTGNTADRLQPLPCIAEMLARHEWQASQQAAACLIAYPLVVDGRCSKQLQSGACFERWSLACPRGC